MIDEQKYLALKELKWGEVCNKNVSSWAIWADLNKDEENIDVSDLRNGIRDVSMFDDPSIIDKLNTEYVFIGLNASNRNEEYIDADKPWHSFHSAKPRGNDYKLRFALLDEKYRGSYLTDIFKDFKETNSNAVRKKYSDPKFKKELVKQFKMLENELSIVGAKKLIPMGTVAHRFLISFNASYVFKYEICPMPVYHYACNMNFCDYREHLRERLSGF